MTNSNPDIATVTEKHLAFSFTRGWTRSPFGISFQFAARRLQGAARRIYRGFGAAQPRWYEQPGCRWEGNAKDG